MSIFTCRIIRARSSTASLLEWSGDSAQSFSMKNEMKKNCKLIAMALREDASSISLYQTWYNWFAYQFKHVGQLKTNRMKVKTFFCFMCQLQRHTCIVYLLLFSISIGVELCRMLIFSSVLQCVFVCLLVWFVLSFKCSPTQQTCHHTMLDD